MALYAFDGTWNEDKPGTLHDTNVIKFQSAYGERSYYRHGVGTRLGFLGKAVGGVTGAGGQARIREMTRFLQEAWDDGDHTIDIIGFSRGAALALHFANMIATDGIQKNGVTIAMPRVRFLGLWDTVGSFGIPIDFSGRLTNIPFQEINLGYDLSPPDAVMNCFHAMAIHERRQTFELTRLDEDGSAPNIQELWFRGVHSDVGGGNGNVELSDAPLHWMLTNAAGCGLPIPDTEIKMYAEYRTEAGLGKNFDPIDSGARDRSPNDRVHESAVGDTLAIGDTKTCTVIAKDKMNWSKIRLTEGAHYKFDVRADDTWIDGSKPHSAAGWKSGDAGALSRLIFRMGEGKRRYPEADWFELIGSHGYNQDLLFRIGLGSDGTFTAPSDDELYLFANDHPWFYRNNKGEIEVSVTRVADPGARSLDTYAGK